MKENQREEREGGKASTVTITCSITYVSIDMSVSGGCLCSHREVKKGKEKKETIYTFYKRKRK